MTFVYAFVAVLSHDLMVATIFNAQLLGGCKDYEI